MSPLMSASTASMEEEDFQPDSAGTLAGSTCRWRGGEGQEQEQDGGETRAHVIGG